MSLPSPVLGAALVALLGAPPVPSPDRTSPIDASVAATAALGTVNAVIGDASFVALFERAPGPGDSSLLRIAAHLAYAEALLRAADITHLPAPLRVRRAASLDRLTAYRRAGQFPDGERGSGGWRPTFVDDRGRRCAVAYLVEQSAGTAAAFAIDGAFHHAYVGDIDDPAFEAWVAGSGFTREELAILQPRYSQRPVPWTSSVELESQTGFNVMQPVAGATPTGRDPIGGLAALLRFTNADPRFPRWIVAFDGQIGRFSGESAYYDAHARGGRSITWEPYPKLRWQELGATVGAGVNGISGVAPAALALPADLFWRLNLVVRRWPHDPPTQGLSLQLRGRGEAVVLGRAPELLWSAAADYMWYWSADGRRYDVRLSAVARRLAGVTFAGGEIGFDFGTPVRLLNREPSRDELDE
jgi:hypothetical protein